MNVYIWICMLYFMNVILDKLPTFPQVCLSLYMSVHAYTSLPVCLSAASGCRTTESQFMAQSLRKMSSRGKLDHVMSLNMTSIRDETHINSQ